MSLAAPNEPLILADGTRIDPSNGSVIKEKKPSGFVEIPNATQAQDIVAKTRRSVAEMPVAPGQMNIMSLVLFYTMWGLSDGDIAITIGGGITVQQIANIKKLDEYKTVSQDIVKTVLEHEAGDIRTFFQKKATVAAEKIVALVDEEGALGFKAAQDVLDRAGFRPADIVEHRHKIEDTLKIEYIRKDEKTDIPIVDVEYQLIENRK